MNRRIILKSLWSSLALALLPPKSAAAPKSKDDYTSAQLKRAFRRLADRDDRMNEKDRKAQTERDARTLVVTLLEEPTWVVVENKDFCAGIMLGTRLGLSLAEIMAEDAKVDA